MKTYRLGDMPSVEEQDKFGVRHAPKLHIRAIRTGEFRPPVKGEWYLSGACAEAWKTRGNLETPYHILRLVRVENREVIVAMNSSKRRSTNMAKKKNPGKPRLGTGARFKALVKKLSHRKGRYKIRDAKALAAAIGRKKYGKSAFQKMAARGKWRKRAMGVARRKAANPVIGFGMTLALAGVGAYLLYKYVFKKGSRKPTASAKPTDGKSTADKTRPVGGQRPTGWRRPTGSA